MSLSGQLPQRGAEPCEAHHRDRHPVHPDTCIPMQIHSPRAVSFSSYPAVFSTYPTRGSPEILSAAPHFLLLVLSRCCPQNCSRDRPRTRRFFSGSFLPLATPFSSEDQRFFSCSPLLCGLLLGPMFEIRVRPFMPEPSMAISCMAMAAYVIGAKMNSEAKLWPDRQPRQIAFKR